VQVDYIKKIDRSGLNAGAKQYALGYTYALSKRTNFYSTYSAIHQGSINYAGSTGDANQIDRIINLGVRHTF
jgi:GBP family porin